MARFKRATWETQWLKLGIAGDTGTGKSMSSILLALGITDVLGGHVAMVDMDARRSSEYHGYDFDVDHMSPPYTSAKISEAIKDASREGYTVLILDGMEKEHQDMLDEKERVQEEKFQAACEKAKRQNKAEPNFDAYSRIAWGVVKPARKELVTTLESASIHLILTFAATEKVDDNFNPRGWIPTTGARILKALKWLALLKPGADGRPDWKPEKGERDVVKNPEYLRPAPNLLTREVGARFARWARGDHLAQIGPVAADIIARMRKAETMAGFNALGPEIRGQWGTFTAAEQRAIDAQAVKVTSRLSADEQASR
jgi:hypothetical protein